MMLHYVIYGLEALLLKIVRTILWRCALYTYNIIWLIKALSVQKLKSLQEHSSIISLNFSESLKIVSKFI